MSEPEVDAQLRHAAERFLADEQEATQRSYLGVAFPIVERAVMRATGDSTSQSRGSGGLTTDEALLPVLDKCLEERFVRKIAVAASPSTLLRVSAYRATLDLLRKPRARIALATSERHASGDAFEQEEEDDVEAGATLLERIETALDRLPEDKRVLADVTLGRFDERDVAWLAAQRKIPEDEARRLLEARCATVRTARDEQERTLTARLEGLSRLQERLELVRTVLHERDVVPRPRRDDADDVTRWPRSLARVRALDDESLRAFEAAIAARVVQWARLVAEAKKDVGKPLGTQPGWRDIAVLLGRVSADAREKDLADAQNLAQQHVKRLLKKLGDDLDG